MFNTTFWKKLFCKHYFVEVGTVHTTYASNGVSRDVFTILYQCANCGRRKYTCSGDPKWLLNNLMLDKFKMWENYQCSLDAYIEREGVNV